MLTSFTRPFLFLAAALLHTAPVVAQTPQSEVVRPPDLLVVVDRVVPEGKQIFGVYSITPDPSQPGLLRVKVWEETPDKVLARNETIRCSPAEPLRVTNDGQRLFLRHLNPGGQVTLANRLDHLVWWASCFPEQAGKDPGSLGPLARQLGYSGGLVEREVILPVGNAGPR
jgi:hypothetical protein